MSLPSFPRTVLFQTAAASSGSSVRGLLPTTTILMDGSTAFIAEMKCFARRE